MALTTQETSKPATQCMFSEMEKCGALWSLLATGLGRLNADGAFLCVNPALEVLLGASNRVVAGEAFARFFPQVPPLELSLIHISEPTRPY